jgi:hypothetical protein
MRLVHGFVGWHVLTYDVAGGEDVRHVGAHLDVDVDEASVGDGDTGFVGSDFFCRSGCGLRLAIPNHRFAGRGRCPLALQVRRSVRCLRGWH